MSAAFHRFRTMFVLAVLLCGIRAAGSVPVAQESYGSLKVGELMPSFASASPTGETYHSQEPSKSLTIYSVATGHPSFALDVGEKVPSPRAQKMGARLFRTGDYKIAKLFGMKVVNGKPSGYDTSMLVLCDAKCRVLRIWTSAGIDDLDMLLKQFEAERATSAIK